MCYLRQLCTSFILIGVEVTLQATRSTGRSLSEHGEKHWGRKNSIVPEELIPHTGYAWIVKLGYFLTNDWNKVVAPVKSTYG